MILNETYTLSNSVKIPKHGLGTWMLTDSEAAQAVRDAVAMGYRHIDTAQAYGNEAGVGEGDPHLRNIARRAVCDEQSRSRE